MGSSTFISASGTTANPTVTVGINTAVSWDNNSGGVGHDVTFDSPASALAVGNGSAGNIPLHTSGVNQRQFAAAGNYAFHCTVHGPGMKGTVIVQ
ncbi:MAG TPA: plastocyanin/azurin family copper-binding protein [Gemmatimonadaceae bacterium]|nr:plastocyanin/azurin family copper-binding protein [Gemmatimonadaceae bacterium]